MSSSKSAKNTCERWLKDLEKGKDPNEIIMIVAATLPFFINEELFYKLPIDIIVAGVSKHEDSLTAEEAETLINQAYKQYGRQAILIVPYIKVAHLSTKKSLEIMKPFENVQLFKGMFRYYKKKHDPTKEESSSKDHTQEETLSTHAFMSKSPSTNEFIDPFFQTIIERNMEAATQILKKASKTIEMQNKWKRTPLLTAVENDDLEMSKFLIEKGANVNNCPNVLYNFRTYHHFIVQQQMKIFKLSNFL